MTKTILIALLLASGFAHATQKPVKFDAKDPSWCKLGEAGEVVVLFHDKTSSLFSAKKERDFEIRTVSFI